jgi:hypothetical protein
MTYFEYFGLSRFNAFVAPLYMEPNSTEVCFCYRERRTRHNYDNLCRPVLTSNHACWPDPPAPSWWWHVWSDPHPLETGVVVFRLAVILQLILMSFASQGSHLANTCYSC